MEFDTAARTAATIKNYLRKFEEAETVLTMAAAAVQEQKAVSEQLQKDKDDLADTKAQLKKLSGTLSQKLAEITAKTDAAMESAQVKFNEEQDELQAKLALLRDNITNEKDSFEIVKATHQTELADLRTQIKEAEETLVKAQAAIAALKNKL